MHVRRVGQAFVASTILAVGLLTSPAAESQNRQRRLDSAPAGKPQAPSNEDTKLAEQEIVAEEVSELERLRARSELLEGVEKGEIQIHPKGSGKNVPSELLRSSNPTANSRLAAEKKRAVREVNKSRLPEEESELERLRARSKLLRRVEKGEIKIHPRPSRDE